MAAEPIEIVDEPVVLYRLFDAANALLYVGISRNPAGRWKEHAAEKSWWPRVARKTVVMYGSRMAAEIAEGRAIRSEAPLHNIAMGRTDPEAKRAALRKAVTPPPPTALRALGPREAFTLDAKMLSRVDAYAEEHDCSRARAVAFLLLTGILMVEADERMPLEDQLATVSARFAGEFAA